MHILPPECYDEEEPVEVRETKTPHAGWKRKQIRASDVKSAEADTGITSWEKEMRMRVVAIDISDIGPADASGNFREAEPEVT